MKPTSQTLIKKGKKLIESINNDLETLKQSLKK